MLCVTHIQRFCTHDGPGVRTTAFLKGCSLRCFWCHNPETLAEGIELRLQAAQCIGCGLCRAACPAGLGGYGQAGCTNCQACAAACPTGALAPTARRREAAELAAELARDRDYFARTGGGLTFSGGEPLLQAEALAGLLSRPELAGLHIAIDTAGNVPFERFEAVLPRADLFLYDVKCADPDRHRQATGADNRRIWDNLTRLCGAGARVWVRIPVIPGFNDEQAQMAAIGARLSPLGGVERVELLPFHRFGAEKYAQLNLPYPAERLQPPPRETLARLARTLERQGVPACYE